MSAKTQARRVIKRGKNKKTGPRNVNIPSVWLRYDGPMSLPKAQEELHTTVLQLDAVASYTSSVGGVIADVINNDPSGYLDWSSAAGLWDEYRVLSMKINYFPNNRYSKTTTICNVMYGVIDRDSSGALASKGAAIAFESVRELSLEDPWGVSIRMDGEPDSSFITTAATAATWWFKVYVAGLSNSTVYGDIKIVLLVQFRGRN